MKGPSDIAPDCGRSVQKKHSFVTNFPSYPTYRLIYADPPWEYRDKCKSGKRGVGYKYDTMKLADICRLPVWDLADPQSCLLAMWWVPTQPAQALKVLDAWGFRLVTMKGFSWHKVGRRQADKSLIGMGHLTRANSEDCLFAVRGRLPERFDRGICQHVTAPRPRDHSEKPAVFRDLLGRLVGEVPRIELFARGSVDGWDMWGDQAESNSVNLLPAKAVPSSTHDFSPDRFATLNRRPVEGVAHD